MRGVFHVWHDVKFGHPLGAQFVHDHTRQVLLLQKSRHQVSGGLGVAACLDDLVEQDADGGFIAMKALGRYRRCRRGWSPAVGADEATALTPPCKKYDRSANPSARSPAHERARFAKR